MSEKRKDSKGRILRTGESQRSESSYMYRYTDLRGNRQCIYAATLSELRDKEDVINQQLREGVNFADGLITVYQLTKKYLRSKRNIKTSTRMSYETTLNMLKTDPFGQRTIKDIKMMDVKEWLITLHEEKGWSYNSIQGVRTVLKPAFQTAVEDDIIRKNPFSFRISDIIINDSKKRFAIDEETEQRLLDAIKNDQYARQYYDILIILLETGMRVTELLSLTKNDVDLKNRVVNVDKQVYTPRKKEQSYAVCKPKTESGIRKIPLTQRAVDSFRSVLSNASKQKKVQCVIDGYTGFIFPGKNGYPVPAATLQNGLRRSIERYNRKHKDQLPHITPHILRHTFCSRKVAQGMDLKSLQYVMGHSHLDVTMNVYAHPDFEVVKRCMLGT